MKATTARAIENWIGWMILAASITQVPLLITGSTLYGMGLGGGLLWISWALFAFATGAGIALIQRSTLGFYLLYAATFLCFFGPHFNFLPLIQRIAPAGPEMDYYFMGANLVVAVVGAVCHWSVAREEGHKRGQVVPIAFAMALIPLLLLWKSGLKTLDGDLASSGEIPLFGSNLKALRSSTPIAVRGQVELRKKSGMILFCGTATEENVREFALVHDLKRMTNAVARVKFLPLARAWKVDANRFPVFNGESDHCYVGRVPKGSKVAFQLCYHPADGRFTAMTMGALPP